MFIALSIYLYKTAQDLADINRTILEQRIEEIEIEMTKTGSIQAWHTICLDSIDEGDIEGLQDGLSKVEEIRRRARAERNEGG